MNSKLKLIVLKGNIPDDVYVRQFSSIELFDAPKNGFWFQTNEDEIYLKNRSFKDVDGLWYGHINAQHSFSILRGYILEYLKMAPKGAEIMFFQYREDVGREAFAGEVRVRYYFPERKIRSAGQRNRLDNSTCLVGDSQNQKLA